MLKKLLNHKGQIAAGSVLIVLLVLVRTFEDALFYDPFLNYFKTNYIRLPLPQIENGTLFLHLLFRYSLNTVLSLAIIYVIFKNKELVKFSAVLYVIFFVFLILAFFLTLEFYATNKMMIFYIRRFLIQPLFLLLFIPAFYFQELAAKKNNVL
jgi:exosortase F-associated protein